MTPHNTMKSLIFLLPFYVFLGQIHAANVALDIAIRPGSEAGALNVRSPSCPDDVFDFRTCEGVVVGSRDLGLFQVKLPSGFGDGNKSWKRIGDTWSYVWPYAQGITVQVAVQPDGDSLKLVYTLTNTGSNTLDAVQLHTCVPTTEAPSFFPKAEVRNSQKNWAELYERLHVWSGSHSLAFSETQLAKSEVHLALMRQGAAPVRWGWWTNSTETFDQPFIALNSRDGKHAVALAFEQAVWASSNVGDDRACFHLFPWFGSIEPGKSVTVKGRLYVLEGGPREAIKRFASDFPDTSAREAAFRQAGTNGWFASEAFQRCHRYLDAWLSHADPATGLIPRNLTDSRDYWNGRDSAADNYPFMVLTAALTDRPLMQGRLLDMLHAEERLTARVDRLTDDYSFSKKGWRREKLDMQETIFDSAEYVKDGLIPLTEWLGPSPWSERMTGLLDDIWKNARLETPFGLIPTFNFEVNGDLLQSGARLYWFTGDKKYLDWSVRLGDYYLLATNHPTRDRTELRLRDHGCEVINGLTELYLALKHTRPEKAAAYRKPMHDMFDRILEAGRNEHGMLYDWFNPQTGAHSRSLCDTWGYDYDGFYTMFLLDGTGAYSDATRLALSRLQAHYTNYPWEGASADGYADSIEGAINLYNREPIASTSAWIDSEIRVMWAKQKSDGIVEGWHGDGNFARTSIMYALWKTQGLHVEPWRADVRVGAVMDGGTLCVALAADQPWEGRVIFDQPRHRKNLHMPFDYPRINQFAEWFTVEAGSRYRLKIGERNPTISSGQDLDGGMPVKIGAAAELRIEITPVLSAKSKTESDNSPQAKGMLARAGLVETLLRTPGATAAAQLEEPLASQDWLIESSTARTTVRVTPGPGNLNAQVTLANGLISRTFLVADASLAAASAATMSFKNLHNGAEFVRSVRPEVLITVHGREVKVGGFLGQPVHNYFDRAWIEKMTGDPQSLEFVGMETGEVARELPWKPRYGAPETPWPPKGKRLTLLFKTREKDGLHVSVHYEMYDGIPLLCKQVVVRNGGANEVKIDQIAAEILAVPHDQVSRIWIESDYTFYKMTTTRWEEDPLYTTYSEGREPIEDLRYVPNGILDDPWKKIDTREYSGSGGARSLLLSKYSQGLAKTLKPGEEFTSFRTYEMLHDTDDAERQGLARRKMFRAVAPWTQENPVFMHLRNSDSESIRRAVDQCVETGFEMIIITFGSGFDMNSADRKYWERIKADFDYAHSKGIRIGGYILFCSTASKGPQYDAKQDVYPPSLCLGSEYVDRYFKNLFDFMDFVGQDVIETDGPYHGYPCEASNHKYHTGRDDSFRVQWEKMADFFHGCRQRGIFVNAPDNYFHHGGNKTGMGYREENWSLPREYQVLIGRQNIYDGTWRKLSSMGWMMTPLVEYHGGGPAATLEPLKDHLDAYGAHLVQNFGSGVQSCYRGPRLYDTDETRILVKNTVAWYKKHRAILDSDIVHVRRPDGQDIDCMLHVNPFLKEKGLAMVYNPLGQAVKRTLRLPLYYTGLTGAARIREEEGELKSYKLDRQFNVEVPVEIRANGYSWFVIE
jgi:hypothetical protein